MRHMKSGKRLGRNTSHRKAMMRNMVTSLFEHEKITTTDARAKELRKMAEKLITMARRGDLHSRRLVMQVVRDKNVVARLFDQIAPRYKERPGGYTRIIKLGHRSGDNASLSVIELVEEEFTAKPKKTPAKKASKPVEPVAAEAPAEEAPAEEAPVEEAPAEEAPVEEAPAEEAPAEEAPAEEAPAEEAPAEEAPAEETPAEEAPAEETPAEKEKKDQ
ncbi:MAG: 50S ribosomal protein L17 [Desulfuromonadales bacterium]